MVVFQNARPTGAASHPPPCNDRRRVYPSSWNHAQPSPTALAGEAGVMQTATSRGPDGATGPGIDWTLRLARDGRRNDSLLIEANAEAAFAWAARGP